MRRNETGDPAPGFVQLAGSHRLCRVAIACADLAGGHNMFLHADEPFHPATTVKLSMMAHAHLAAADGRLHLKDRFTVANRFRSLAEGSIYALDPNGDSDPEFPAPFGTPVLTATCSST